MPKSLLKGLAAGRTAAGPGYLPKIRKWHNKYWLVAPVRADGKNYRIPYRYRWQAEEAAWWIKQVLQEKKKCTVNVVVLQFESPIFKRVYGVYYRKV